MGACLGRKKEWVKLSSYRSSTNNTNSTNDTNNTNNTYNTNSSNDTNNTILLTIVIIRAAFQAARLGHVRPSRRAGWC